MTGTLLPALPYGLRFRKKTSRGVSILSQMGVRHDALEEGDGLD